MIHRQTNGHLIKLIGLLPLFVIHPTLAITGSTGFQPQLATQLQYEDNVRRAPAQNEQSDLLLLIKPTLPLLWGFGKHSLDLTYKGAYGQYQDQNILNYNDHRLTTKLLLDHSIRLNSEYEMGQIRDHNTPDDNNVTANLTTTTNRWRENYAKITLSYGNPSSRGQLITKLNHKQLRYTNNNQQFLDLNSTTITGMFYYRVAPKTRIPFELSTTNIDYQNTNPTVDPSSNEQNLLTGITWDISTISTALFQIGALNRNYNNSLYKDTSILMLRLDGTWKPNSYTNITIGAIRDIQESLQANSKAYIQNHIHTEITHMTTPRMAFIVGAFYTSAKTDDLNVISENRLNLRLQTQYSLLPWLHLSATYNHTARDSDLNIFDFTSNAIMFGAQAQFGN